MPTKQKLILYYILFRIFIIAYALILLKTRMSDEARKASGVYDVMLAPDALIKKTYFLSCDLNFG